jgi:hypothetical protein
LKRTPSVSRGHEGEARLLLSRRQLMVGGVSAALFSLVPAPLDASLMRVLWRLTLRVLLRRAAESLFHADPSQRTVFRASAYPANSGSTRRSSSLIPEGFTSVSAIRGSVHVHPGVRAVSTSTIERIRRHRVIALWVNDMANSFAFDYENTSDRAVAGDLWFDLRDLDTGKSTEIGSYPILLQAHAKGHLPAHSTHWWQNPCFTSLGSEGPKLVQPYLRDVPSVKFQTLGPIYVANRGQVQQY